MTAIVLNCRCRYAIAPSWIALAISIIFGRALVGGEHAPHEEEADEERQQRGGGGEDEPEPLASPELEDLVAALGQRGR